MRPLRVLVVEDNALVSMLLADMLTEMGHEVCGVESTESAAVTTALRCRPDLMILDARLGAGCGIAAMERIERVAAFPHLFASGDIARVRAMRPNAVVIQKPFFEADLAGAIERVLATMVPA